MNTNKDLWSYHARFVFEQKIFQTKAVEKFKTRFIFSNFFSENGAVYENRWNNIVERGRPQIKIWCIRIVCWITKATNTHSEYVIIIAFAWQQWLHERALTLRYMCIACLV